MLLFLLHFFSLSLSSASVSRSRRLRAERRIGFVNLFFHHFFFLFFISWFCRGSDTTSNFNKVAFIKSTLRITITITNHHILPLLKQSKRIFFCSKKKKTNETEIFWPDSAWKVSPNTNFDNFIVNDNRPVCRDVYAIASVYLSREGIVVLIKF